MLEYELHTHASICIRHVIEALNSGSSDFQGIFPGSGRDRQYRSYPYCIALRVRNKLFSSERFTNKPIRVELLHVSTGHVLVGPLTPYGHPSLGSGIS